MTDRIETLAALEALYDQPIAEASILKEVPHLIAPYRAFIEASPFFVLATAGEEGLDCSPRGDQSGSVRVLDDKTILIPDRRGNNRIDSLRNIVRDPRVALLFLVPGVGETMRVNGRAEISIRPDLLASFAVDGKPPRSVLIVTVETAFFQCARAVARAGLWDASKHPGRGAVPSAGEMLRAVKESFDAQSYDAALPARQKATLY